MLTTRSLKLFGVLLIALLTMQSVMACYDSHGGEESGTSLQTELSESELPSGGAGGDQCTADDCPSTLQSSLPQGDSDNLQDCSCNHCCHCHNSASLCLPSVRFTIENTAANHWVAAADSGFPHGYFSALFRPPIA